MSIANTFANSTTSWITPPSILRVLGPFDLDPCACATQTNKTATVMVRPPEDGLADGFAWKGRVWLNPPYGRGIEKWMRRLAEHGDGIALVFAKTETAWFQEAAKSASAFLFIRKRISFLRPDMTAGASPCGSSVLIAYGVKNALALIDSGIEGIFLPNLG